VEKGGRFENDLQGCKAARKADKELAVNKAKSSRIDKFLSQHQFLQSQLLEQSQLVSNAEKRIIGVEKQLAKLQQRVEQLEWDNQMLQETNISTFGMIVEALKVRFWRNYSDNG
jgi:phage shock protein A